MTYKELVSEVAALGFEETLENEGFLLFAANRAQHTILADRPKLGELQITVRASEPDVFYREIEGAVYLNAQDAFSFRAPSGTSFTIAESDISKSYTADEPSFVFRHRMQYDGVLTFAQGCGACDFSIYHNASTMKKENIPVYEERLCYDLSALAKDFLGVYGAPTDSFGNEIPGAMIHDGMLYLPRKYSGTVHLYYKRIPTEINADTTAIDLPRITLSLLPILTAAYVWLDDEPEKAQYYMNLYREGIARLVRLDKRSIRSGYGDINGWG